MVNNGFVIIATYFVITTMDASSQIAVSTGDMLVCITFDLEVK